MSCWYTQEAPFDDMVVSSRIRLARNLGNLPFPRRMTEEQFAELKSRVKSAVSELPSSITGEFTYIEMDDVPENEIHAMVERHVISPEFAEHCDRRAIVISKDESISIMIGEEDHLRIQVTRGGLSLDEAYAMADALDTALDAKLGFAFDSELGFLTECPTNIGTGLRASVMMHLPACEAKGEISGITDAVGKIGLTVRGMYGEGSKSYAALYQISNQITLGISEKSAVENLRVIAEQVADREQKCRDGFDRVELEDIVCRAYGTLQNARLLRTDECMQLISKIKLGVGMGILDMDKMRPVQMLIDAQPYMLQRKYGVMGPRERDEARARMMREQIR